MLTAQDLHKTAGQAKRDIKHIEIDVLLTFLLQLFVERGIMDHLAFKGGTMLRKMIFGQQGRLSTDLDFTLCSETARDDMMIKLLESLTEYRGIRFQGLDDGWYITDDGGSVIPICCHDANDRGEKIKIQVSSRERPVLRVEPKSQLEQVYFRYLDFEPTEIPSLAFEEVISEKVRAASQRTKIRDLYDLSEISHLAFDEEQVRSLAVLKLWQTDDGLDYAKLCASVKDHKGYEVHDLDNLIAKENRPTLEEMIRRVIERFSFLQGMTDLESELAADRHRKLREKADELTQRVRNRAAR